MKTYHTDASRDGGFWLVRVRELERSTQALRRQDIPEMAADLIEIVDDLSGGEYDLRIEVS